MGLAVICSHFNPCSFHLPRRNLLRFLRQMTARGIPVFVAELAYETNPFFLPHDDPCVIQFRSDYRNVLWHKENLLNLAAERVPERYDKLAWVDPDLCFISDDWFKNTEQSLERYAVVQLFSEAYLTDEDGRCNEPLRSTMSEGVLKLGLNHPGFAWGARRELWRSAGGLCELAILGGGDTLFAGACLNNDIPDWIHYPEWKEWISRAREWIGAAGGASFVPGIVIHEWHGSYKDRLYVERQELVKDLDIARSVERREDGLLKFTANISETLRKKFRDYFIARHEDG